MLFEIQRFFESYLILMLDAKSDKMFVGDYNGLYLEAKN